MAPPAEHTPTPTTSHGRQNLRQAPMRTPTTDLAKLTMDSSSSAGAIGGLGGRSSQRRRPQQLQPLQAPTAQTPHGRAALRQLGELRAAAALTPAGRASQLQRRRMRQSGRHVRETPRDLLRTLGRVLAPQSRPIPSSSSPMVPGANADNDVDMADDGGVDDDDGDIPIDRPRLSAAAAARVRRNAHDNHDMDVDEDDIASLHHSSSGLAADQSANYTAHSIEVGRRALPLQEQRSRLSGYNMHSLLLQDDYDNDDPGRAAAADLTAGAFALGDGSTFDAGRRRTLVPDDMALDSGFFPVHGLQLEFPSEGLMMPVDGDDGGAELGTPPDSTPTRGRPQLASRPGAPAEVSVNNGAVPAERLPDERASPPDDDGGSDGYDDVDDDYDDDGGDHNEGRENSVVDVTASAGDAAGTTATTRASMKRTDQNEQHPTKQKQKRTVQVSRHGIPFPSIPVSMVRALAVPLGRQAGLASGGQSRTISRDVAEALAQASDWFFQQVSEDLAALATHAGRRRIDESDVVALMRRQRLLGASGAGAAATPFSLASSLLPRELLQHLHIPAPRR